MPVFLYPVSRQASLQEEVGVKKLRAAQQRLFFLDLDYGAQRKTRDAVEGNPQYMISSTIIVQTTPQTKAKKANPNNPNLCNNQ
jgi:hypothetical protein